MRLGKGILIFLFFSSAYQSTELIYENTGLTGISNVRLEVYPDKYYNDVSKAVSKYVSINNKSPNILWFGINVNKLRKKGKGYFGTVEVNLMRRAVFLTSDTVTWDTAGPKDKLYTLLKAYTASQSIYNDTKSNSIENHVKTSIGKLLSEMFAKRKTPGKPMVR
jgi:hypothetical protein